MGRKSERATRPTREQKVRISAAGLVPNSWLVLSDNTEALRVISKRSGVIRTIKKAR